MLDIAGKYNKPVVIHSRGYFNEILEVLSLYPGIDVLFHCFSYGTKEAKRVLDRGYMVSFSLNIFRDVCIRYVPLESLFVETDSPYIYFERNESTPLHIRNMYQRVSCLKNIEEDEFGRCMIKNTINFFKLDEDTINIFQ